jgi:hypothetical protein
MLLLSPPARLDRARSMNWADVTAAVANDAA